jgi:hypothetical protein
MLGRNTQCEYDFLILAGLAVPLAEQGVLLALKQVSQIGWSDPFG